jgi:plastocyanin
LGAAALAAVFASFTPFGPAASASPASHIAAQGEFVFVGSPFDQPQGEVANFSNPAAAGAFHNVYATGKGPDGRSLFFSETIAPGNDVPVRGTQYLGAGNYPFACTLHPGMDGVLQVTDMGRREGRPSLGITVPSQRLSSVRRKGAVRILVSSSTGVQGGRVTLRLGEKALGVVRAISIPAGGRRAITARLSPQGKRVLEGKRSAAVSATTWVEFGKPSTSRKVLR